MFLDFCDDVREVFPHGYPADAFLVGYLFVAIALGEAKVKDALILF